MLFRSVYKYGKLRRFVTSRSRANARLGLPRARETNNASLLINDGEEPTVSVTPARASRVFLLVVFWYSRLKGRVPGRRGLFAAANDAPKRRCRPPIPLSRSLTRTSVKLNYEEKNGKNTHTYLPFPWTLTVFLLNDPISRVLLAPTFRYTLSVYRIIKKTQIRRRVG